MTGREFKKHRAYNMRHNPTPAEYALKVALIDENPFGKAWKFQHVAYGYIADFYNYPLKVCVEVDGGIHNSQKEHDAAREKHLALHGIRTIRFSNEEVLADPAAVARKIKQFMFSSR